MNWMWLNVYSVKFQDYFSSYEMCLSVCGSKMDEPREKKTDTPASRVACLTILCSVEPTPDTELCDMIE